MDKIEIYLSEINGNIEVEVKRKRIKRVYLKVYRDLAVRLSLPMEVSNDWVIAFLKNKSNWIDKQVSKYKQSQGYNSLDNIIDGSSIQYLGKDMRICIAPKNKEAQQKRVEKNKKHTQQKSVDDRIIFDEKVIRVEVDSFEEQENINKQFNKFWRKKAESVFIEEMQEIHSKIFKKYKVVVPSLSIRKMQTLWGSCTKSKNKITLNEYLLKADIRCIQYVLLHEMTHLLHQYHNADFYDFLTIHMPDWKRRKKQLDNEIAQGL
ncbi:MAG: M48 family metallopeptidase [Anaerovoracaceae bacterium]